MRYLLLAMFVSSCGYDTCQLYDFRVAGLCITTNGYDVESNKVAQVVGDLEYHLASYGFETDLDTELNDMGIDVEYVLNNDVRLLAKSKRVIVNIVDVDNTCYDITDDLASFKRCKKIFLREVYNRGIADLEYNKIIIGEGTCLDNYYVLAHEILHVVAEQLMGISNEDDVDHNVPYVFYKWAYDHNKDETITVEHAIYLSVKRMCE